MGDSKTNAKERSKIQCVEVLISKNYVSDNRDNIFWTLSVYSLENQPVKRTRAIIDSEIYHFMVYDWKRTIKQLLDDRQIPYSILQHFSSGIVYSELVNGENTVADNEGALRNVFDDLSQAARLDNSVTRVLSQSSSGKKADLLPF